MTDPISAHDIGRLPTITSVSASDIVPIFQASTGAMKKTTAANLIAGDLGVTGPASSTDNAIVRWDSTTGQLVQNSAATMADTTGAITIPGTTNQLVLGTTNTTTFSATAPSASRVITFADPGGADSVAYLAATQSLTNKTISGGTNTISGAIYTDITRCSTQKDAAATTTLANITGLSQTVVPGTYLFRCILPGTADGTGGIKYAFKYTTTVLTSIAATGLGYTASAVAVQFTTTATDQALLFDQAAAVIMTVIEGSMVVATGGTIALQQAQHAANNTSSTYVGAMMKFERIA